MFQTGCRDRGSSPIVREGVRCAYETPSLTVGLLPRKPVLSGGCHGRREVKLERITKIFECFIFGLSLAHHVNLDALRYEPVIFLPNAGGEFLFQLSDLHKIAQSNAI